MMIRKGIQASSRQTNESIAIIEYRCSQRKPWLVGTHLDAEEVRLAGEEAADGAGRAAGRKVARDRRRRAQDAVRNGEADQDTCTDRFIGFHRV